MENNVFLKSSSFRDSTKQTFGCKKRHLGIVREFSQSTAVKGIIGYAILSKPFPNGSEAHKLNLIAKSVAYRSSNKGAATFIL